MEERKKRTASKVHDTIEFVLSNLFDLATIAVAAYLVIRHQIAPFTSADLVELTTWVLALLGLIAVTGLWDRNRRLSRIEALSEEVRDLVLRRISGKASADEFFVPPRWLSAEAFSPATKVVIAGITLARSTREYMHVLGQRLVAGAHVRLMVIDPEKPYVMEEMASRSMGDTAPDYWRTRMQTVSQVMAAIAATPGSTGTLEIGYLPFIPAFGLTLIDHDQPHGFCLVELYHHRSADPNPTFRMTPSDDPLWYRFFVEQADILWRSCRVDRKVGTASK